MLPDAVGLVKLIKKAALDAIEASKPVNVFYGKVTSISPLKINVEQKLILGKAQLVLTRNVTDFDTYVSVDWNTGYTNGGTDDEAFSSHRHSVSGKKKITIHNALAVNDEVILVRQQGGQKYIVLDRIGVMK